MQLVKTLFWVAVAVVAVIFSMHNWTIVPLNLWDGLELDVKLPVLLLAAFLAGLVPTFVLHRATRWKLRRRLAAAERSVAELEVPPSVETAPPAPAPFADRPRLS